MASVVFLRGMNLGNRRITNDDLASAFRTLGYSEPTPYQASGNVILPADDLVDPKKLSAGLAAELGYEVPVFVRSGAQVSQLATASPFASEKGSDGGKPQVVFLNGPVSASVAATLAEIFGAHDRFEAIGTEIHWLPEAGLAEAGPLLNRLDKAVGGTTVRTLGTVERIAKKL